MIIQLSVLRGLSSFPLEALCLFKSTAAAAGTQIDREECEKQ
jgi:hypothetical protein